MLFKKGAKQKTEKSKQTATAKKARIKLTPNYNILRIVLWCAVSFIFLRGVLAIVTTPPTDRLEQEQEKFISTVNTESSMQVKISAFAEGFIKNYSTYQIDKKENYTNSLKTYADTKTVEAILKNNLLVDEATAVFVKAVDTQKINDNQFDVTVMADVVYTKYPVLSNDFGPDEDMNGSSNYITNPFVQNQIIYYKVPIYYKDGRCAVEAAPMAAVAPEPADLPQTVSTLIQITDDRKKELEQLVSDFTNSVFTESQSKINYFLLDTDKNNPIKELNTSLKLNRISEINLFENTNGEIFANVSIQVSDVNGSIFLQQFSLSVVKKDRYLIKDIGSRPKY